MGMGMGMGACWKHYISDGIGFVLFDLGRFEACLGQDGLVLRDGIGWQRRRGVCGSLILGANILALFYVVVVDLEVWFGCVGGIDVWNVVVNRDVWRPVTLRFVHVHELMSSLRSQAPFEGRTAVLGGQFHVGRRCMVVSGVGWANETPSPMIHSESGRRFWEGEGGF